MIVVSHFKYSVRAHQDKSFPGSPTRGHDSLVLVLVPSLDNLLRAASEGAADVKPTPYASHCSQGGKLSPGGKVKVRRTFSISFQKDTPALNQELMGLSKK